MEGGINHVRLLGNIFHHVNFPVGGPSPLVLAQQPDSGPDALGLVGKLGADFQSAKQESLRFKRADGAGSIRHEFGVFNPFRVAFLVIDVGKLLKMGLQHQIAVFHAQILRACGICLLGTLVADNTQFRLPFLGVDLGAVELVAPHVHPAARQGLGRIDVFSLSGRAQTRRQQYGKQAFLHHMDQYCT